MIRADQKRESVKRKFSSTRCESGPAVLTVTQWLTASHRFTLTCGIEGFKGGEESVCTHHHRVTVNHEEYFSISSSFLSLCGSLRKCTTPPSPTFNSIYPTALFLLTSARLSLLSSLCLVVHGLDFSPHIPPLQPFPTHPPSSLSSHLLSFIFPLLLPHFFSLGRTVPSTVSFVSVLSPPLHFLSLLGFLFYFLLQLIFWLYVFSSPSVFLTYSLSFPSACLLFSLPLHPKYTCFLSCFLSSSLHLSFLHPFPFLSSFPLSICLLSSSPVSSPLSVSGG